MLGLSVPTDDAWIQAALADVDALLVDHAHCEMKAATNAMSLAVRHGDRPELVQALVAIAQEELAHFARVHAMIVARGIAMRPPPVDPYAAELRRLAGGRAIGLVDRLLVGALIEARSCERFRILAERCVDRELSEFYAELLIAEATHYRTFVDLAVSEGARDGLDADEVRARLRTLAAAEGGLVQRLADDAHGATSAARATVHG
jgi:tRNA-(ms[2]io[6]A)-hydroxylase